MEVTSISPLGIVLPLLPLFMIVHPLYLCSISLSLSPAGASSYDYSDGGNYEDLYTQNNPYAGR
jgi:hypothetical protein